MAKGDGGAGNVSGAVGQPQNPFGNVSQNLASNLFQPGGGGMQGVIQNLMSNMNQAGMGSGIAPSARFGFRPMPRMMMPSSQMMPGSSQMPPAMTSYGMLAPQNNMASVRGMAPSNSNMWF